MQEPLLLAEVSEIFVVVVEVHLMPLVVAAVDPEMQQLHLQQQLVVAAVAVVVVAVIQQLADWHQQLVQFEFLQFDDADILEVLP